VIINRLECTVDRDTLMMLIRRHMSKFKKRVEKIGERSLVVKFQQGFIRFAWRGSYYRVSVAGIRPNGQWDGFVQKRFGEFCVDCDWKSTMMTQESPDKEDSDILAKMMTPVNDEDEEIGGKIDNLLVVPYSHRLREKELLAAQLKETFAKVLTGGKDWMIIDHLSGRIVGNWHLGKLSFEYQGDRDKLRQAMTWFAKKFNYKLLGPSKGAEQ
jgi:hypothetical protein